MTTDLGISADVFTWPLYFGILVLWGWSLRVVPGWSSLGWQSGAMSLFGYVWLGFFTDVIVRFLLISWDSYLFGNMSSRLADATSDEVNKALLLAGLYFACLVVGYFVGRDTLSRLLPIELKLPTEDSRPAQLLFSLLAGISIVLSSGSSLLPVMLITPLGILGTLWVIPAFFIWSDKFRHNESVSIWICLAVLLPGLVRVYLSPYRENLLTPVLIVILAAMFAGVRFRITRILVLSMALFFISTTLIYAYRQVVWNEQSVDSAVEYARSGYTLRAEPNAKWVQPLRRFHGFDSLLLTVRYVPDLLPYSDRNVFIDAILNGFIPRAIFEGKEGSDRGVVFGQTIWSYESMGQEQSGAAIAPSMPGDLYEAGGTLYIAIGAILWGIFVGFLERWRLNIPPRAAGALVALFAFHCFASVERDYVHVAATTIQYLIVMYLAAMLMGAKARTTNQLKRRAD